MKKTIFRGRLLHLSVKDQKFPNGYKTRLEVIKHPGAALIVPFLTKNSIIMIKQFRPVINEYIWELPAGTLHKNESPLNCAKREIIEETGYKVKNFKKIGAIYPAPGYTTERIIIYKATNLIPVKRRLENDEIIQCRILSRAKINSLLRDGRIIDAKTICALSLCKVI